MNASAAPAIEDGIAVRARVSHPFIPVYVVDTNTAAIVRSATVVVEVFDRYLLADP